MSDVGRLHDSRVSETQVTLFGAGLLAVQPLSTDIYLPAMVDIGYSLGTDLAGVQATMVAFTVGFALSHFWIGGLGDRFGRRPVALAGLTLFAITSALGAVAPSLTFLIAARFLQGCAAATGPILARAIVRDVVDSHRAGRVFSVMGALVGLAPVTAPLAGGALADTFGWRATLGLLAVYAGALTILVALGFPETLKRAAGPIRSLSLFHTLKLVLRDRSFVVGTMALAFGYGALFAWLSTSSFLLVGDLGLTRLEAALVYSCGSVGFVSGGLLSARLSTRLAGSRILLAGGVLTVLGTVGCALVIVAGGTAWTGILIGILPFYVGWGLSQPQAIAIAMRPFAAMAGQASAWLGIIQQIGGLALSLFAVSLGGGVYTLAVMAAGAAALACTAVLAGSRSGVSAR